MSNRWVNALVKTIITLAILHVAFVILGYFIGTGVGWFGWPMIWPHWHDAISIFVSIIATILLYFGIYGFCSGRNRID